MNNIRWANESKTGICYNNNDVVVYIESGELYDEIVSGAYGPVGDPFVVHSDGNPPTQAQVDALRKAAYQDEADPLFFKAQRGEIDLTVWTDKIAEIRLRYPDPA